MLIEESYSLKSPVVSKTNSLKNPIISKLYDLKNPIISKTLTTSFLVYEPEYQEILSRAVLSGYTIPSLPQQVKENQVVLDLKLAGLLQKALYGVMFKTNGDSNYACLNWASPSFYQATKINNPSFTSNLGFNSNGSTSYLNTNFTMGQLTQNSVTYCSRAFINVAAGSASLFGASNNQPGSTHTLFLNPRNPNNNAYFQVSDLVVDTNLNQITSNDATTRYIIARDGGVKYISMNGGVFSGRTLAFVNIGSVLPIYLLASNSGGSPGQFSTRGISYFWIFDGKFSNAEASAFDSIMNIYLN